jgi:hypothetical protein
MTEAAVRKPFMPPSREALGAEWRRSFVRAATGTVLAQLQNKTAAAELITRAAVEPTKQSALPGDSISRLMLLAPESAAAKLFALAVKVDLAGIQLSFPLPTSFAQAAFVEEGAPIPVGQGTFAGMPVGPVRKLALIAALTTELERATSDIASTVIEHVLRIAVGNGLATVLFSADPASAIAPAGLLNGVTPIAGSADMAKDLSALIAAIADAGIDTSGVVFICSPAQALTIELQAGPNFAHRIIEESSLTAGTVIAVATAGLVVAGDGIPSVDVSKQTTAHFADPASPISTPGAPATVAAPTRSLFQTDSFALRCIARITWAAAPGSVAAVTGATW